LRLSELRHSDVQPQLKVLFPGKLWLKDWKQTTNKSNHIEFSGDNRTFSAKDAKSYLEFELTWRADLGEEFVPSGLSPKKRGNRYSLTAWVDPDDAEDTAKLFCQVVQKLNRLK